MTKGAIAVIGLLLAIPLLLANAAKGAVEAVLGSSGSQPSDTALADIPPSYLALYRQAATVCPGLDWSILAAIGKIETNHGHSQLPGVHSGANSAGAGGPMQFLQSTWDGVLARHQIPSGGESPPSRYNPHDAIHAAAFNLCDNNAPKDLRKAIFSYNHADWYVDDVLAQADDYAQAPMLMAPDEAAAGAIAFAQAQIGQPYVWGGNGPDDGGGFDCSGLTAAAYRAAGITLPRTAHTQYHATTRIPEAELQPGDLVFYGNPNTKIHHVGLYIGNNQMIDAPTFGKPVGIHPIHRGVSEDFAGGGRVIVPAGNSNRVG